MAREVVINAGGNKALLRLTTNDRQRGNPQREMLRKWAARYGSYIRKRHIMFSRGGGDWDPLKPKTVKRRRKARRGKTRGPRQVAILVDNGFLRDAIEPNAQGNLLEDGTNYVDIGYAGQMRPSDTATYGDLAKWHHTGAGNLPQRELLVNPDQATLLGMARDAKQAGVRIENILRRLG